MVCCGSRRRYPALFRHTKLPLPGEVGSCSNRAVSATPPALRGEALWDLSSPAANAPAAASTAANRGEFATIPTRVPGLRVCEHLPRLAARADRYALVRTLSHRENNHLVATHHVLTGHPQPGAFFDKVASRDDWPSYASALDYLRPRQDGVPSGVNLPTFLMEGPLIWPGQHAGFLGPRYDPWQITRNPGAPDFRVDGLSLAPGIEVSRLSQRQALLEQVNRQQRRLEALAEGRRLSDQQQRAFSILTSGQVARAFEMD